MQELEKILKEIDETIERYRENANIEAVYICYGMNIAKKIIRKHMNSDWIPENKQPETCKYTGGSCCWPIDQCGECPNNQGKEI